MDTVLKDKMAPVKLFLIDIDGVMTDGRIVIDNNGVESKFFHVRDGHGIKLLQRAGIKAGIISGRISGVVSHWAGELGISIVCQGAKDKIEAYRKILDNERLEDSEVAYIGDDVVDLPVLRRVGFSVAVADASESIIPHVDYVTKKDGGRGAVREVTDLLLHGTGLWDDVMKRYF